MSSWLETARKESHLSPEDCASALSCSRITYLKRENKPGTLTLDEIRTLCSIFSTEAKAIVKEAIVSIGG